MSMPTSTEPRSLGRLVSDLSEQTSQLVRAEVALAKAEVRAKAQVLGMGAGLLTAAGILALYVLAGAIATAILALSTVWAPWLAALVVTAFLLLVTIVLAAVGAQAVKKASRPSPTPVKERLQEDVASLKAGLRS